MKLNWMGINMKSDIKDECIHLPLKQFELLFELAKHPNQIFSKEQLIEKDLGVWITMGLIVQ